MNRNQLFALGMALLFIALLFSFSSGIIDGRGLFGLLRAGQSTQLQGTADENQDSAEQAAVSAGLSLSVLQRTELEASTTVGKAIPQCPGEAVVEIRIENSGQSDAEKVFMRFPSGVRVIACSNCAIELLRAGQSAAARARLCREETSASKISIGSANSNSVELELG